MITIYTIAALFLLSINIYLITRNKNNKTQIKNNYDNSTSKRSSISLPSPSVSYKNPDGITISSDRNSGDYSPFANLGGDSYDRVLSYEEMKEGGYTECVSHFCYETGHYAHIYK